MAMALDKCGSLYCAGRGGVWVVSSEAKQLGLIAVPGFCSNVTFGGEDGKTLYLTCKKKV
jgi:gluconolactonase